MIRKQLYIDEDLETALKVLAARTGQPEAAHVRAALRDYLNRRVVQRGHDPLEGLIGLVPDREGPDDVAKNHDEYLYASGPENG